MNKGLLGFPKGLLPTQGFGLPLGAGVDVIRSSRSALVDICLQDDPVALYTFQESSGFAQDYSGRAMHITTSSGTIDYRVAGPFGDDYGIRIDGQFSVPSVLTPVVDNWTMEVVWNIENCDSDDSPNTFAQGTAGTANISLFPTAAGKFQVLFGNVAFMAVSNGSIEGVGYTHVVAVREAGTLKYYLDGAVDTANAGTSTPGAPNALFRLGSSAGTNSFVYALAAVYDQALSASRVAEHFAQTGL